MSVLIQINGENAGEAIKELSALAAGINGQAVAPAPAPEAPKPSRGRTATKPAPAAAEEGEPKNEPTESDLGEGDDDGPVPTVVELRAKAQEVGTTPEAKKAIKALLDEFGSKSISDVPENKRHAFMSGLAGLAE
ncbi:hypothetical protein SAMN04487970_1005184 [Paenibacillus tianmuensis]|uniref:Uncharacterized protein n=1 Tax=Paenibacillus tianmuensis TaxID=624147 RepID=A0A1G4Q6V9_9BACL|nr:hypothetical protein [Paenibacillus tianmuensis]SCW40212.1 hypothetical protein SAMN04487970_1005184 [Paenibacillus tianmuensis]